MTQTQILALDNATPTLARGHDRILETHGGGILPGDLGAGTVLPDIPAASRTTVRHALRVRAAKGMIERRSRAGNRVRLRDDWNMLDPQVRKWALHHPQQLPRIMTDPYAVRMAIEPVAAAQAALHATPADHAAIARALRGMAHSIGYADRAEQDLSFHLGILRATGNPLMLSPLHLISGGMRHVFAAGLAATPMDDALCLAQHRAVADAIMAGDAAFAERAMRTLLLDAKQRHDPPNIPAGSDD